MDHFPIFGDRLKDLIFVTIRDEVPYDNRGFFGFELRAGFSETEIYDGLLGGDSSLLQSSPSKYASFLQSWFYWAMLNECMDRPIDYQDYIEQGSSNEFVLTTKFLERDLIRWALQLEESEYGVAAMRVCNTKNVREKIESSLQALSDKIEGKGINLPIEDSQYWLTYGREILPHDLEVSICALGLTLDHTLKTVSSVLGLDPLEEGPTKSADWYTPPFLLTLSQRLGFCKSDMRYFEGDLGFVTALMAVSLSDLCRKGDHSNCSEDRCEADNVKHHEYRQIHAHKGCTCSELLPVEAWKASLDIIAQGAVPVVRVKPRSAVLGERIDFEVMKVTPGTRYLAYSHLWADGRGNVTGNGIFECQWRWLQEGTQLYENANSDIISPPMESLLPFWIDTFCVPRGLDDRMWQLRTKAILSMSDVYRSAEVVMMLDSQLDRTLGGGVSTFEFAMRLKFCGWNRRVWTLHEGSVAQRLLLRTEDRFVDLWDMKYRQNKPRKPFPFGKEHGWILLFFSLLYLYQMAAAKDSHSLLMNKVSNSDGATFHFAWMEVPRRTTSFLSDRYLVLGIIMRASKDTLLALQRNGHDTNDGNSDREKLKLILLSAPSISQTVIFGENARFPEFGMQWAPATLDSPLPYARLDGRDALIARITGKGAIVSYKGWRFTELLPRPSDATVSVNIGLHHEDTHEEGYALQMHDIHGQSLENRLPSGNVKFAIILSPDVLFHERLDGFKRAAIVREMGVIEEDDIPDAERKHDDYKAGCVLHVEHLKSVRIRALGKDNPPAQSVDAEWINDGHDQLWCVG